MALNGSRATIESLLRWLHGIVIALPERPVWCMRRLVYADQLAPSNTTWSIILPLLPLLPLLPSSHQPRLFARPARVGDRHRIADHHSS
ncbi:MAG: hypothetical protein ABIV63_12610, partial [Caldimonas sp.]